MEIRSTSLNFPRMRGSGPRTAEATVVFPRTVDNAVAALAGYSAGFRGDDHHLGRLQVKLDTEITANIVTVRATFGLRDWSGDWDDDYAGTVQASVLAELVDPSLPPPRGDLQITGVETNQATQSFRSSQHLDIDNVLPDNAISLVGGKTTGLRVYVDHGADASLPVITGLSGEVEVSSGANTLVLAPISTISPRRDSEIDRGSADHTLNFAIPEAWCRGSVDIRIRVFDAADPGQSSAPVRRTLRFVDVNPMRVFAVGIHYTGQGMDLPAPDASTALQTFDYARRTFPTGDVLLSGYTDLDFGEDMVTTDTTGCGDGFESLNGKLKDLRGDSDDLYYGLLPTGVNFGNFIGCGGDGVGSGMVGDTVTAAHEAGHAYGRPHAPCDDSGRCANPSNQDDDFPQYALFDSDSIGEFGYDPENNRVFDPASAHDFMGYSPGKWVSPYTYAKLMSRGDPVDGAAAANRAAYHRLSLREPAAEWNRRAVPLLFLDVHIDEDRSVTLPHAFTFAARPRRRATRTSDFHAVVVDKQGKSRACVALSGNCFHCGPQCWPMHLSAEVPLDSGRASRLEIREHAQTIASFDIPPPPALAIESVTEQQDGSALLSWSAKDEHRLVHVVQWHDIDGSWRGVAPRQHDTVLRIPARLRSHRQALQLRILSSNGLATAVLGLQLEPLRKAPDPDKHPPVRVIVGASDDPVRRAWAIDQLGRSLGNPQIHWFDEKGGELARGSSLDTRQLQGSRRNARVVAINAGAGKAEIDVEITGRRTLPPRKPTRSCNDQPPAAEQHASCKEKPSC